MRKTGLIGSVAVISLGGALVGMVGTGHSQRVRAEEQPGKYGNQPSTANGEWPMYTADLRGSKYSPLNQIDAQNFGKLEVAWRFKTDSLGPRPEGKLEGTPIMVKGTVYATAGTRRAVVALDGRTGELKWVYSMEEGERATRWSPRQLSGRGLSYWTDGKGDERIYYVTIGYRLVALNAKTGQPVQSFGAQGVIDLKQGVVVGRDTQIDLEKGEIGLHATPTVVGDTIIVGSAMAEGLGYRYSMNTKGLVRAFDVRTGKQIWRFNMIPGPGEFGNDSWENGSWEWTGNTGVWTQISVDPDAGLVYLPVETPTIDEYGGNRPGNNLFAESLVAVDLKTGVRKWHFQMIHHGLWDQDNSSASLLVDAIIDGRPRKIVAQPTKQSWLYVFDRVTGQPIWPIPEVAVPQSDIPGEKTSKTQPIPTKPPAYSRPFLRQDDLIDFTPALRAQALANLKKFRWEQGPFVPPVGPQDSLLGAINVGTYGGGVNWPGSGFDPETATFYTQAQNAQVISARINERELTYIHPDAQAKLTAHGRVPIWEAPPAPTGEAAATRSSGSGPVSGGTYGTALAALSEGLEGLPLVKPPYGVISAIDLNTGTLKFQVPHGDTPDAVRNHPLLRDLNVGKTGQIGGVGILVTKTLVIAGDPEVTRPPARPRGAMLRAYNKETGEQVGEVLLPAPITGQPMTYRIGERQFIIVGVSGGNYTGEYIALALPSSR